MSKKTQDAENLARLTVIPKDVLMSVNTIQESYKQCSLIKTYQQM